MLLVRTGAPTPEKISPATFPVAKTLIEQQTKTFDQLLVTPLRSSLKSVLDSVHLDVYGVLPCAKSPSEAVVMLTGKYSTNKPVNTFADAQSAVTVWEPFIAQDIGFLLYPQAKTVVPATGNYFEKVSPVSRDIVTEFEKNSAVVVDGSPGSIYYVWTLNYVFFATSQLCLEDAMAAVYPAD